MTRRSILFALSVLCLATLAMAGTMNVTPLNVRTLDFEANRGQAASQALFLAHGNQSTLFLTSDGVVVGLSAKGVSSSPVQMSFAGARARKIESQHELPGKVNYLIGRDPSKWQTNVPTFARVRYERLYPGIDAVFYGREGSLEYDLIVAPGASPEQISLKFEGAASKYIASNGDLVLRSKQGEVRQQRPIVYQTIASKRHELAGRFVIRVDNTVGLEVAPYDHKRPLVIDPTLVYSTFIAGLPSTGVASVAVDGTGHVYATGSTYYSFPTKNPIQGNQPSADAFVTKFAANGGSLVYSTYLGGNGVIDGGSAIGVDRFGNAYVVGGTGSSDFPVTAGAIQTTNHGGREDAFAAKLNAAGSALVYSTYLGGGADDSAKGLAIDSQQRLYIAGFTCSNDFPVMNAYQPTSGTGFCSKPSPGANAFVARINTAGTALDYSTYLGGTTGDGATGIAVDSTFNAYVTGVADSPDFPVTPGAFQTTLRGPGDAFVTKFSADGKSLVFSTFVGGSSGEGASAIALDSSSRPYITGSTNSTDFPVTASAFQKTNHGMSDVFVTKLWKTGGGLIYSTYLGGSDNDIANSIAVDGLGQAHVVGDTASSTNFPVKNPIQSHYGGDFFDAFVTKVAASGSSLIYSTYFGGSGSETASSVRLDGSNNAYVGGSTSSTNFRTTAGAFSRTFRGRNVGWVAKIHP